MGEPVDTLVTEGREYAGHLVAEGIHGHSVVTDLVNEVCRLQSALTAAQQRIADLEAQCARVQRDAERYAWLRDDPTGRRMQGCVEAAFTAFCAGASQTGPECLDVAIDAAMAAKVEG